jgi:hypothetical protein
MKKQQEIEFVFFIVDNIERSKPGLAIKKGTKKDNNVQHRGLMRSK